MIAGIWLGVGAMGFCFLVPKANLFAPEVAITANDYMVGVRQL